MAARSREWSTPSPLGDTKDRGDVVFLDPAGRRVQLSGKLEKFVS